MNEISLNLKTQNMVNRYVKIMINLKKRIITAHAARPNVYMSVLGLLSLSILRL